MPRFWFALCLLVVAPLAHGQFVWPKPEYNRPKPGLYEEDPFIIEYRKKFFAVFRGDFKTFEKALAEVTEMVKKNPQDARAMVWLGNGETVKAGLMFTTGDKKAALALLEKSRRTLDAAVALKPDDPNIYMMRAATLYIQGQYWPNDLVPRRVWETLRDDCLKFTQYIGPEKMKGVSIHLRGETYGELGIAYKMLGDKAKAIKAFQQVIALNPGTDYEARARREINVLNAQ